jgi:hypothetical protein
MMEAETVSETLENNSTLTSLIAQDDFIAALQHHSLS